MLDVEYQLLEYKSSIFVYVSSEYYKQSFFYTYAWRTKIQVNLITIYVKIFFQIKNVPENMTNNIK
jgi:hypothetical protein